MRLSNRRLFCVPDSPVVLQRVVQLVRASTRYWVVSSSADTQTVAVTPRRRLQILQATSNDIFCNAKPFRGRILGQLAVRCARYWRIETASGKRT